MTHLITTPTGMFNPASVNAVSITDTGVAIADINNNLIHFIEEKDKDNAKVIIKELSKAVASVGKDTSYQPDWEALGF
ncbi:hypothetical protein [Psychromonas hadalis]|uniref:hypothetical protein n=1 Tax=Psychromonas hadalis TaxID=211669 RepID=UPI0003B32FB1|nr:hypothetical protein [Psychromonas hadalis]